MAWLVTDGILSLSSTPCHGLCDDCVQIDYQADEAEQAEEHFRVLQVEEYWKCGQRWSRAGLCFVVDIRVALPNAGIPNAI